MRVNLPPLRSCSTSSSNGHRTSGRAMAVNGGGERGSSSCGSSSGVGSERGDEENGYRELSATATTTTGKDKGRRTNKPLSSGMFDSFRNLLHRSNEDGAGGAEMTEALEEMEAVDSNTKSHSATEFGHREPQRRKESTCTQIELLEESSAPSPRVLRRQEPQCASTSSSSAWAECSQEGEYASPEEFVYPLYDTPRAHEHASKSGDARQTCCADSAAASASAFSLIPPAGKCGEKENLKRKRSNSYVTSTELVNAESRDEESSSAHYEEVHTKAAEDQEPVVYENEETNPSENGVYLNAAAATNVVNNSVAAEYLYDVPPTRLAQSQDRPCLRTVSASTRQNEEEKKGASSD